ncbi:copper resistance protein B [Sphingomonas sp.]|uniref:copper resistance protein B n=1 Tax=Sphingomonas sp. TaxID=28214 RepID=UPI002CA4779C|nr:copper resistance protein B [Sphingomonas sp.]HWK36812.1 copper resistance protein B [Sphingomonas sp.]
MRMIIGVAFIAAIAVATPALAQHDHQGHPAPVQPPPAEAHAQHRMEAADGDPHAGHDMPAEPATAADPHAGHQMPPPVPTETPPAATGHRPGVPDPPVRGPSAAASSGPAHAADAVFGTAAMAPARAIVRREHGDITSGMILIDRLESVLGKGRGGYAWDAQGWYGGDIDRLWIKTEGEGRFGKPLERVEAQALWSHAIDPWWNLQTGVRHDFRAGPDRSYAVVGVQGLAPYWFEIDSALFLSDKGDVTARIAAEYDQRLTRKLILQPAAELNFAARDVPELGIGSGLSTAELGLRLRYQFVPEFAPYVGVRHERAFGDTAAFRRARDERAGGWNILIGVRSWF